jgi:membrane-anchored protein YejM (alkaline phosphatase superfamily)
VGGEQVPQRKGEADDPLAQWDIGKHLISQQGRIFRSAKAAGIPTHVPLYAATVDAMDQAIGQVLDTLNKDGLAEHSTVFFFSDNGASREEGICRFR